MNMIKNIWCIEVAYTNKDGEVIVVRDIPMEYHPHAIAAVIHHDLLGINTDLIAKKLEQIEIMPEKRQFASIVWVDGCRIVIKKAWVKQII